jgi:hypothetical protein
MWTTLLLHLLLLLLFPCPPFHSIRNNHPVVCILMPLSGLFFFLLSLTYFPLIARTFICSQSGQSLLLPVRISILKSGS